MLNRKIMSDCEGTEQLLIIFLLSIYLRLIRVIVDKLPVSAARRFPSASP